MPASVLCFASSFFIDLQRFWDSGILLKMIKENNLFSIVCGGKCEVDFSMQVDFGHGGLLDLTI